MKYICVYGASSTELDGIYYSECEKLGVLIAKAGFAMAYGGGAKGVMGSLIRGVKSQGGHVLGVAPSFFDTDGILSKECDEFVYTLKMSERKDILAERASAFVACPGGIGTMDELFEALTLKQLGLHSAPIVILNINGCYDNLIALINDIVVGRFSGAETLDFYKECKSAAEAAGYLENVLK